MVKLVKGGMQGTTGERPTEAQNPS